MAQARAIKTSFTSGELAPKLSGRGDLRAYDNGARQLRNVFIQPTGGVTRRPGLRHLAILPGAARMMPFEFNTEQTYLLVFVHLKMLVFMGDVQIASIVTPWTEAHLPQLACTQSADTLLVAHPDVQPRKITRNSHTSWSIAAWGGDAAPFFRFADISLRANAATGAVTVTASASFFAPEHAGGVIRISQKRLRVNTVTSATTAVCTVIDPLDDTNATTDWDEAAFSNARGWPVCLCFHQDRLVIGGSRDLPNRLWLSRSGDLFNFDLGSGLDDEAIEFGLVSDQVNAIRAVFSGRHLQVFTSGTEWMVTGDPLTPANVQLNRQTRIGSPVDRMVTPVDVDGSTIFIARSGKAVHEFIYTDMQQAYQANDLALVAEHLVNQPVSMAYDQIRRLLHVVMRDGSMATLTLYRAEEVTAWTRQETQGAFQAVAEVDGTVYVTVERLGSVRLERFDPALALDAAIDGTSTTPRDVWLGLAHLQGCPVGILADGAPVTDKTVKLSRVMLDDPCLFAQVGLKFTHIVEPLPPAIAGQGVCAAPLRLVSITFRVMETSSLRVDIGRGLRAVPLSRLDMQRMDAAPPSVTGDIMMRALGWRSEAAGALWRIESAEPLPMTVLAVTTQIRSTE